MDLDPSQTRALRFVLAPSDTPPSAAYAPRGTGTVGVGEWLEVCPQGLVCAQEMGRRVVERGGAALIADYGGVAGTKNTLRVSFLVLIGCQDLCHVTVQGFSKHQQHDVLEAPGMVDLTADVNFQALATAAATQGTYEGETGWSQT